MSYFCHGFPETSYAWRHQVSSLARCGFSSHCTGTCEEYGGTERPAAVDDYTVVHLVGDMVALLDALGEQTALIVGNGWGATVAWQAVQMRPDRFRGIVALSVPMMARSPAPPTSMFPQTKDSLVYTLYFQQPGVAEAEFDNDPRNTLRKILCAASGEASPRHPGDDTPNPFGFVSRRDGLLAGLPEPRSLPGWLTENDLDQYAAAFAASGFRGGLEYYRNLDRNWELQASLSGTKVDVPAMFMAGERDPGMQMPGMADILKAMPSLVPLLQKPRIIEGAGHWLPQERPNEVSGAIIEFARAAMKVR